MIRFLKVFLVNLVFLFIFTFIFTCKKNEKKIDDFSYNPLEVKDSIPLKVIYVSPLGSVEGYRETFKILIGFNQPMIELQAVPREEKEGPLEINPFIKGKYRWLGTRTLAFIPDDTLPPATLFKVTLKKDKIKSIKGAKLSKDTSWAFETVRPKLLYSYPYYNKTFIDTKSFFFLLFNINMDPVRCKGKIKIVAEHGNPSHPFCGYVKPKEDKFIEEIPFTVRNLKDEDKKDWFLKEWKNENTIVLIPLKELPKESKIKIVLEEGLLAREGNLGLSKEEIIVYNTYNFFSLIDYSKKISGDEPLKLCFSNPVIIKDLIDNIEFEPPVEIPDDYNNAKWDNTYIHLYFPFKLNTKYRVKIKKELKDKFGKNLDKDYVFIFEVGDYNPKVNMPEGIILLESEGSRRFPVTFVNVDKVYYKMGLVSIDNAINFLKMPFLFDCKDLQVEPNFWILKREWLVNTFKNYPNKKIRLPIMLDEILGERKKGLVFIQLDTSFKWQCLRAFLEVTNLGVTWKYSPENNLVLVTSLENAKPLENVKVQLRNNENQILFEGFTDKNGFCEFPGWAELGIPEEKRVYEYESEYEMETYEYTYEPEIWLTLSKENDNAVYSNKWNFGIEPWRFNIFYEWEPPSEEYGMFIFTEKGLYRAGEVVNVKGILRKKKKGIWILPDIKNVEFLVKDSRGTEIFKDTIPINEFGSFIEKIELSKDAPTGVYSIKVSLPQKKKEFEHYFHVEAYKPAEFEVKVESEKDTFIAGEIFKAEIKGKYLFGMPIKNAELSWNLYFQPLYLKYPQYKNYNFGYYEDGSKIFGRGKGKLDENGKFFVKLKLNEKEIKFPLVMTLEGTVIAPDKRSISGRQNWPVFNSNLLIGLKTSKYVYLIGDTVKINMITIEPSGKKVGDKNVEIKIFRREWKSIKKARFGGRYEWVSERIDEEIKRDKILSRPDSTLYKFLPEKPGNYFLEAIVKDEKGRESKTCIYFYIAGRGYVGWEMRDDDIIELVADKDIYQVGDTAKILVKSPYDTANALITVEREVVLRKWQEKIYGNAAYIKVPITLNDIPNIYVCVMLFRGRTKDGWNEEIGEDLGKPQFKIGYVNLKVDSKEKHLNVKTWTSLKTYKPGDSVTVFFSVKDYKGKPVKDCEVALFVVDVGVLNFIDFKTPDPFSYFYGPRPLHVKTIESRLNVLGERNYGEKGEERGGGGVQGFPSEGIPYRQKFISTPFYCGTLSTDKEGKGKVKFELPDNLTKFRIMAVAQTKNHEFGSAESTFVVNLPFMITPSLPRFLRIGDECECGVVLHNRTEKKEKAFLECSVEGLKLLGSNKKEILLSPHTSKEIRFKFIAEKEGKAVLKFNAKMGKEKDALLISIPVILPHLKEAVATFSSTKDSAFEDFIIPENIYPEIGGIEFYLSPSILCGIERGIEHLLTYPYDCLEQKLSRILPLIVGEDLINQFNLAKIKGKELRDTVQKIIDEIKEYQFKDGGFGFFKDAHSSSEYLSAYTMYVLKRAYDAGYRVDSIVIARGKHFLLDVLNKGVDWNWPYNINDKLTTKAFSLYSLSLWGEYVVSYASQLFEYREKMPIFGKILLLRTIRILNMGKMFEDELVRMILNKVKLTPTSAYFEESENRGWTFPSPAKVTAYVIQIFMELGIDFPYKAQTIKWLVEERKKKSLPTTHENAFVFDAFQTYYKNYEKEEPNFVTKILIDQKEILKKEFFGRAIKPPYKFIYEFNKIPKGKPFRIKIIKEGIGNLYYVIRMCYALKENPFAFDEGFYISKKILNLDNKEVKKFKRGEIYKVILQVVTPETRIFAVVDDPLPAGFVPVQVFFETESQEIKEKYWTERQKEKGYFWGGFQHREIYDDKVLFFAQHLFPGEHTLIYFVRAATSGKFLVPSTKVEEMYSPEIFGSTPQNYIFIE